MLLHGNTLCLCLLIGVCLVRRSVCFGVQPLPSSAFVSSSSSSSRWGAARNKESMAEKRARRKSRQQRTLDLPKSSQKVTLIEPATTEDTSSHTDQTAAHGQPKSSSDVSVVVTTKAQALIEKQRRSVAMLTLVKESIGKISAQELAEALESRGYHVVDNFLNDPTTVDELRRESIALVEHGMLSPDTISSSYIASGVYVGPIQGGEEQYIVCPRSVEWVVSTTKHFGSVVVPQMNLDSRNCLGRMRTFDRQAFEAARDMLLVQEKDEENKKELVQEEKAARENLPYHCLVDAEETADLRRLSLRYYLVPSDWSTGSESSAGGGGGMEFANGPGVVDAKCDRLVIWKSSETAFRNQDWEGCASHRFGSCLELDLVKNVQL